MSEAPKKCAQCGKPIETLVTRKIFGRDRDPYTRKAIVTQKVMEFCSEECGLHCQYAHEG